MFVSIKEGEIFRNLFHRYNYVAFQRECAIEVKVLVKLSEAKVKEMFAVSFCANETR